MRKYVLSLAIASSVFFSPAMADVRLHSLFQDNLVLQQGPKAPVWGRADPGEQVMVRFNGQQVATQADKNGKWMVQLKNLRAGGPHELTVTGKNTVTLKNVLVGEVWVASGQSNMEWTIAMCGRTDKKEEADAKAAPRNAKLRIFTVAKIPEGTPVAEVKGAWVDASPESVSSFSAVAYFFGRELQGQLNVPVAVISTSWGGTRAEAWTKEAVLRKLGPSYDAEVDKFIKNPPAMKNPNAPSALYNGMIHPLLPFAIKGFIWYQGESNVGKAYHYDQLFGAMIKNWRDDWHNDKLPFYFVQLAPFLRAAKEAGNSAWAELRETQRQVDHKSPFTGMAVITDLGHEADIHPTPKRPVGERLAWMALEDNYGWRSNKGPMRSPDLHSVEYRQGRAYVTLTSNRLMSLEMTPTDERKNSKTGDSAFAWRSKEAPTSVELTLQRVRTGRLFARTSYQWVETTTRKNAEILGFAVAGKDGKYVNAKAQFEGGRIVVWADQVSEPVAVRYGWADHPICNVFGTNGLPVTPFRSDNFAFTTAPKEKK